VTGTTAVGAISVKGISVAAVVAQADWSRQHVDHAVDPGRRGIRDVAEVRVVRDVITDELAHRPDDPHGGLHRRVGAQPVQVVEQLPLDPGRGCRTTTPSPTVPG